MRVLAIYGKDTKEEKGHHQVYLPQISGKSTAEYKLNSRSTLLNIKQAIIQLLSDQSSGPAIFCYERRGAVLQLVEGVFTTMLSTSIDTEFTG